MIENICNLFIDKIRRNDETINDERAEVLAFGLIRIVEDLIKLIAIIIIAALLGIIPIVLFTSICMMLCKSFIGGAHMRTNITCFIVSALAIFGSILLAKNSINLNNYILYVLYTISFIFDIFVVFKYAPADTEAVPILSKRIKKRNKALAFITVMIFHILAIFIIKDIVIANLMLISLFITAVMATPVFYKIVHEKYSHECEEFRNI